MVLLGDLGEVFGFRAVQLHVLASRVPKHLHQVSTSGLNLQGWIGLRDPVARNGMILCEHDRIHRKYSAHLQSHVIVFAYLWSGGRRFKASYFNHEFRVFVDGIRPVVVLRDWQPWIR